MIKVAIIGTGNISAAHIEGYLQFPERCKIVALVDIYPEKAEEKKKRFGLTDAEVYDDHRKILDRNDIELFDVCTPPYVHSEITINALNAGKNVLVEKPMAASLEECDAMLEAAQRNNKLLSIVAQNRFRTGYMRLKQVLDSGLAGDISHVEVDSYWWRDHSYYDLWWRGTWEKEGGGCTLNHAIHHIDMMIWMAGMPEEIQAAMSNTSHDNAEVEDLSVAILKFKNRALGQITSSVVHHGEEQQIVFQCKKARISAPWKVYASKGKSNGFPERNKELENEIEKFYESLPAQKYEGHTPQIDDVLKALETNSKPLSTGEGGRRALELITAIYKSASINQSVKLPLTKDDPFYTVAGLQANLPHFYEKSASIENFEDESITFGREV
ncbi:Gfo/Idh/MocA family oxidoreductase [Mahella sp.]|uniref:Gfo/Idh/MocA family protein n=1 Tax=Mahella sp. TaxID=2798721 RepID=UPI0025C1D5B8|nr:Gfo/Idh/MocA family oxidoreductase [Mahella sp.]MBZ4665630.1 oxidoreductase domain protein [Mahella sp.]